MLSIVEKLINLREIFLKNGQKEAVKQIENVMKNIEDKDKLRSLEVSLNLRAMGDLYIDMYYGDWWKILTEAQKEVQELYFILESKELNVEKSYIDMVSELYNFAKEIKDDKLLFRLEEIRNNYNSPDMIRKLIKICVSQGARPSKYFSERYGNWKNLLEKLYYEANAYLKKIENSNNNNYDKVDEYVNELKKQFEEYFLKT